eukprot:GDKI01032829.1.p1 GENE.GDKI01032829.1~~GDKI01032829.1.p1  ORF type:complete len:335 (-),score=77.33 GDKI01032829.1:189-1193(-)
MEKYRQYADHGTGVHPFIPAWSNYKPSFITQALKFIVMFPVSILRYTLFGVTLLSLFLAYLLTSLIPIPPVKRLLRRLLYGALCRTALLLLGFFSAKELPVDHRRLKLRQPLKEQHGSALKHCTNGTLVVCNYTSPCDVLYLAGRLAPTFAVVHEDGTLSAVGVFGALGHALGFKLKEGTGNFKTITSLCHSAKQHGWGPVVYFPEGCKSNGSCVLAFKQECWGEGFPEDVCVVGVVYGRTGAYTPHHTVNSGWWHLYRMCYEPYHTLTLTAVGPSDVTPTIKGKPATEQSDTVRNLLSRVCGNLPLVNSTAEQLAEFEAYWRNTQGKKYAKKA